jgi:hypothetical protein
MSCLLFLLKIYDNTLLKVVIFLYPLYHNFNWYIFYVNSEVSKKNIYSVII